ncbi:DUF4245 family protein [Microbacterium limosum]|uniref:DUF4245 family protein n=1 Tax=Microbacterium limosum TaxID=3079935 RepID=A0AAU0MGG8_9MICO|nr:DUF4245 family protein [Microbacterium sp. Y20]WOQ68927.1 DUF4245 family protein [Microbacterium sp. Y20]
MARVVAELGRPETPEETAARKAESSARYHSSQTFRNLIAALLVTVGMVAVMVFVVPRGELPERASIDPAPIAEQASETYQRPVLVPAAPQEWRVNAASVSSESAGTSTWDVVYAPGEQGFLRFSQAFDAEETWARGELRGTAPADEIDLGGVMWQVFEPRDPAQTGNISYALGTQAGPDYVLVYGSTPAELTEQLAATLATQIIDLQEERP